MRAVRITESGDPDVLRAGEVAATAPGEWVAAAVRRSLREGRFPLARDPRRVCVPRTGVCVEV